jgi:hypothetical protein
MLAKLQEKGINSYDKAAQELKDTNEELYFYTPRHRVTVKGSLGIVNWSCTIRRAPLTCLQDQISSADGVLLVVTPPLLASETFFTGSSVNELKESAPLFAKGKAIILVTIPYATPKFSLCLYHYLIDAI